MVEKKSSPVSQEDCNKRWKILCYVNTATLTLCTLFIVLVGWCLASAQSVRSESVDTRILISEVKTDQEVHEAGSSAYQSWVIKSLERIEARFDSHEDIK